MVLFISPELSAAIYTIATNVSKIEKGVELFGSAKDSQEQRHLMYCTYLKQNKFNRRNQIIDQTSQWKAKRVCKEWWTSIIEFILEQLQIAQKKASRDFEQVINRFQRVSKQAAKKSREFVLRAKEQQSIQM